MKTTDESITLDIGDIYEHGSIKKAIIAACEHSSALASGIIGPSFACSGPGPGWQRNCDAQDYALRALDEEYGACGYVDAIDGRLATLGEDGDVEWTGLSIVSLDAPLAPDEDAEQDGDEIEALQVMVDALDNGHCVEGEGDWSNVRERLDARD